MRVPGPVSTDLPLSEPFDALCRTSICSRVAQLAQLGTDVVVCDLGEVEKPDAALVDLIARIALTARRSGCQVRIANASPAVDGFLRLSGLCDSVLFGG